MAVTVGVVLGAGSAVAVLNHAQALGAQAFGGGWTGSMNAGSSSADPYTRAVVARVGLLALRRSETIYFSRALDDRGRPLSSACVYTLSGGSLPARWWSVTIYGNDNYLPVNGDIAESADATRTAKDASGKWTVKVAAQRPEGGDWISSRNAGNFSLTLRLYNPTPAALAHPEAIAFPSLTTKYCGGGAS